MDQCCFFCGVKEGKDHKLCCPEGFHPTLKEKAISLFWAGASAGRLNRKLIGIEPPESINPTFLLGFNRRQPVV